MLRAFESLGLATILMLLIIAVIGLSIFSSEHLTGMAFGKPVADTNQIYCILDSSGGYSAVGCCRTASRSLSCDTVSDFGTILKIQGKPFSMSIQSPLRCNDGSKTVYINNMAFLYNYNQNATKHCQSLGYPLPI